MDQSIPVKMTDEYISALLNKAYAQIENGSVGTVGLGADLFTLGKLKGHANAGLSNQIISRPGSEYHPVFKNGQFLGANKLGGMYGDASLKYDNKGYGIEGGVRGMNDIESKRNIISGFLQAHAPIGDKIVVNAGTDISKDNGIGVNGGVSYQPTRKLGLNVNANVDKNQYGVRGNLLYRF